jgi:hypothetical protein
MFPDVIKAALRPLGMRAIEARAWAANVTTGSIPTTAIPSAAVCRRIRGWRLGIGWRSTPRSLGPHFLKFEKWTSNRGCSVSIFKERAFVFE